MKGFTQPLLTLLALLTVGAILAPTASAISFLLAEWLVGGVVVTAELLVEENGELLLEDTKVPALGKVVVLCSGIADGPIGPNSLSLISEVLMLNGTAVSTIPLSGTALTCAGQENCEEPLVWAVGLPLEGEVELMEDTTTFFALLTFAHAGGSTPGWEIECMKTIIGPMSDECVSSESVNEIALEGTTLLANDSLAFSELAGVKLGTCTLGGENSGILVGTWTIVVSGGGELTASSEGAVS
jgi:hypothetical protein